MNFDLCNCGVEYKLFSKIEKDEQIYVFWQCPKCGKPTHTLEYKYSPIMCPGHRWEHVGKEFIDKKESHTIHQLDRCWLCGEVRKIPRHTKEAGISGRIDIDDPRVVNTILMNRTQWERSVPKELRELSRGEIPEEVVFPRNPK